VAVQFEEGLSIKNKLVGNSTLYIISGIIPQLVKFILLPVFTRYLSPEEFGIFGYTSAISLFFLIIGSLGLRSYLMRHYYRCQTEEEQKQLLGSIFSFLFVYNLALLGLFYLLMPPLFLKYHVSIPFDPFVRLALLGTTFEVVGMIALVYFRIKEQAGRCFVLSVLVALLNIGFSLYFIVVLNTGILGRYYGQLIAYGVLLVICIFLIKKMAYFSLKKKWIVLALTFALPLVPAHFFISLGYIVDRLFIGQYFTLAQLGIYTIAFSIASGIHVVAKGIYKAIEPRIYKLASVGCLDSKVTLLKQNMIRILTCIGALVIALSPEIVRIMSGPQFQESGKLIPFFAIAIVIKGMSFIPSTYLKAIHKTKYESKIRFVGLMSGVLALFVFIPIWGLHGAALAASCSAITVLYGFKLALKKESEIKWNFEQDLIFLGGMIVFGVFVMQVEAPYLILSILWKLILLTALFCLLSWKWGLLDPLFSRKRNLVSVKADRSNKI